MFGEISIIPLVLRTSGIINISPNTRAIFHKYFSNRVISYTNHKQAQDGTKLLAFFKNILVIAWMVYVYKIETYLRFAMSRVLRIC